MISFNYFFEKLQDVKLKDYASAFPMLIALVISPLFKRKYRDAWLICEEPMEARDNGYHFFKYMCDKQPQQKCFYAIKKQSVDAYKVEKLGDTIEYGSLQHWLAYFLCEYNISSQKGGKPNAPICAFMELNGVFKTKNIFLQHGVIINKLTWLYAEKSSIYRFITSTVDETEYIRSNFGYPAESIICTGLPRFDGLHDYSVDPTQILIMPTWRYWFNLRSKGCSGSDKEFGTSKYAEKWKKLLNSPQLGEMIAKYNLKVIFYLHRNLQRFAWVFEDVANPITIAEWNNYDVQDLLKQSATLITDYSSVFFDMIYMKKPIIFYQFDEEEYRKFQYDYGYFDYHKTVFGKCFQHQEEVISELLSLIKNHYTVDKSYLEEYNRLFPYVDCDNCKRVYQSLTGKI